MVQQIIANCGEYKDGSIENKSFIQLCHYFSLISITTSNAVQFTGSVCITNGRCVLNHILVHYSTPLCGINGVFTLKTPTRNALHVLDHAFIHPEKVKCRITDTYTVEKGRSYQCALMRIEKGIQDG